MRAAGGGLPERVLGGRRLAGDPRPPRARGRGALAAGARRRTRRRCGTSAAVPRNRGRRARRRTQRRSSPSQKPPSPIPTRAARAASATKWSSTPTRPLLSHDGEGGCELEDGSALSPETARRLACDASVVQNGRKTRTIPPALRRALRARDRGCRFPGCENRRFLDAHHVHHWAKGGETTADNLVLLCRRHHRLVHEGGWHVDRRLRFYDRWGQSVPGRAAAAARPSRTSLSARNGDLDIDAETCEPGAGEAARPRRRRGGAARDRQRSSARRNVRNYSFRSLGRRGERE